MKFLHAFAFAAATLTAAPAAFSSSVDSIEYSRANCKRVKKSVQGVCKAYLAHYDVVYALAKQLQADGNSIRPIRAHAYAVRDLYAVIYRNYKVTSVAKYMKKVDGTTKAVLEQLGPLAEEWANYEELQENLVATYVKFDGASKTWMKNKSSKIKVNCDKVDSSITKICTTYKVHAAAVNTYIAQLKADELTTEFADAHIDALNAVFNTARQGKSKTRVKGKVKALDKSTADVVKQIGPLAKDWDNYKEMAKEILESKGAFDKALNAWIEG